jgi:hypothetical protein
MQRFAGSCSPEQLLSLQKVFDLIWMELRANGSANYTGPTDPDALREEIARRVFAHHDGADGNADDITRQVLISFGVQTDVLQPQAERGSGAAKPKGVQ